MPEHTVSENQHKNKYGHNTKNSCKNGRKRRTSEKGKHHKLGNSARGFCQFCFPSLSIRTHNKKIIQEEILGSDSG